MRAYTGKILWVDLTLGTFQEETLPEEIYRKYLGGIGLGAALLYRDMPAGADALGPENILGFMSGLLTGAGSFFTGRWMAVAKSPLTGTWGDANCGGTLSLAIKQCGYDGILFKGISPKPVYLFIDSSGPRLVDATAYWGKDAIESEDLLVAAHTHKKKPAVAVIGQAGENLSLISGICNDRGRLAARSGLGAVMGSKKLKAVVLAGSKRVSAHDPIRTQWLSLKCSRDVMLPLKLMPSRLVGIFGALIGRLPVGFTQNGLLVAGIMAKWGSIGTLPASVGMGDTPFKNWAGTKKDMPRFNQQIDPDFVLKTEKQKYHCRACPMGCGGIVELNGRESHKMEYETAASFTSMLLNDDISLAYELNDLVNRAGMDSISAGGTLAFAMECYEKGLITQKDTGGIDLSWGNAAAIREVLQQMIERHGFGALLSDGSLRAAEKLTPKAAKYAIHAGGQEMAYHDPRMDPGMGLHASVDPTPGRHTTGAQLYYDLYKLWTRVPGLKPAPAFYPKESRYAADEFRMRGAVAVSSFTQFYNAMGMCYFGMLVGVDRVPVFEWANSVTGWHLPPEEYMHAGRRIQTLRQMFNIREGIDPRALKVNKRLFGDPPQEEGPNRGVSYDLDILMKGYWKEIGWDPESGVPTHATLEELGLVNLIEEGKVL
jgi:aldehyde:ferredoxin oxidoreductase